MKKILWSVMAMLVCGGTACEANISVTDVSVVPSGSDATVAYRLNEAANQVVLVPTVGTATTITSASPGLGLSKGLNTVTVPGAAGVPVTITATAPAETGAGNGVIVVPLSVPTGGPANVCSPGVVTRGGSSYQGHIYVASQYNNTSYKRAYQYASDGSLVSWKDMLTINNVLGTYSSCPYGVVIPQGDTTDKVYVFSRSGNGVIVRMNPDFSGGILTTANAGVQGYQAPAITPNNSSANSDPWQVYTPNGNLTSFGVKHRTYNGNQTITQPGGSWQAEPAKSNTSAIANAYQVAVDSSNAMLFLAHGNPINDSAGHGVSKWTSSDQGQTWTEDTTWYANFSADLGAAASNVCAGVALDKGFSATDPTNSWVWTAVSSSTSTSYNKLLRVNANTGHVDTTTFPAIDLNSVVGWQAGTTANAKWLQVDRVGNIVLGAGNGLGQTGTNFATQWGVISPATAPGQTNSDTVTTPWTTLTSGPTVSSVTCSGATITWTTDVASPGRVDYGVSTAYGVTATDASSSTTHTVTLSSLNASTQYYFRVAPSGATGTFVLSTPPTIGTVSVSPSTLVRNLPASITITVPVTSGTNAVTSVTADLSPLGGSAAQALMNDSGTWSAAIAIDPPTAGSKSVAITATDPVGCTSTSSVDVTVSAPSTGSSIPSRFGKGALLATQTRPTGFGDNLSELDQLFGTSDGGNLRLGITGNLENNSNNGIIILVDTKSGGSNPFNYGTGDASLRIQGLNGDTLDNGFNPDYAIDTNLSGGTMFADLYDLQAAPNGKTFLGSVTAPGTAGFTGGGEMSFDNSNTAGVTGADATNAATATTGLEISLPLSRIGNPGGPVKVMVLIQANGNYHSNQTLPGLPDTYGNLGGGAQNYANIPGRQYVTITPAWTANDLGLSQLPWTFEDRVFTGDSSLDNHPPVVNPPTIYNGRSYVVEDVEHYGGSHTGNLVAVKTADGTLDTSFGTNGRVALSGPAAGRVTIRSVGGVVRLFVATSNGTLYSMDASNGGNIHTLSVGSSTSSSPAVMANGATATIYIPVNTVGSWQLKQVTDSASMSETGNLNLVGVTNVPTSPSVIADGTRIQLGCVTSSGGVVYTISSDLSTVFNGAVTANPVTGSPTLASDSTRFYVGDAPASGNGAFYCFNASTGAQIGSVGISGGLEYAPFGDYSLGGITNALYFATNTGQLNAVNPSTLSPLAGYPATPMGLEPATGAVVLFNGNLYVPTAKGMFAVPSAAPTSFARFPVEGQASTPSSAGRVTGSVMATTLASGLVGGLAVQ